MFDPSLLILESLVKLAERKYPHLYFDVKNAINDLNEV